MIFLSAISIIFVEKSVAIQDFTLKLSGYDSWPVPQASLILPFRNLNMALCKY
jgi:hypothetical protein